MASRPRFLPSIGGRRVQSTSMAVPSQQKALLERYFADLSQASTAWTEGGSWTMEKAMREGYSRVVWVWRSVEAISGNSSRLKYRLREGQNVIDDHPNYRVINGKANPLETGRMLRKRLSAQVLLSPRGAFVETTKSRRGDLLRLDLAPPGRTRPVPGKGADVISHFVIEPFSYGQKERHVEVENMRWVREAHPTDPYGASTPLEAIGLSVELDHFARLYNASFMRNDGRPGGILGIKGDVEEWEMDRVEARFGGGPMDAGRLSVVAGDLDYVDVAKTPRDAQYVASSAISKNEILVGFGVPESVIGNASGKCVDMDTEAFTQRGWVSGLELTEADTILALDPTDGRLKWSRVLEVYRNPNYNGEMYRLRHGHMDALVTPGHKWAVVPRPGQGRKVRSTDAAAVLRKVEDLGTHDRILIQGEPEQGASEPEFSDAFVELVGWAVTEGHYLPNDWSRRNKPGRTAPYVQIRQNVGPNADRIERCAKEVGATYIVRDDAGRAMISIRGEVAAALLAVSPGKVMTPDFMLALTAAQRELLLYTMIDADGHRQKKTASWTFGQKDRKASEAFVYLATLCGYSTSMRCREWNYTHKGVTVRAKEWLVIVRQRKVATLQRNTRTVEHYAGLVWCPSTEYGTFVARRHGRVFVTGNTFSNAEAEEYAFWTVTMLDHNDLIVTAFDEDSEDGLEGFLDTSKVEVLQRPDIARREEARKEVAAGLRSIYSYAQVAGIDDVESTPATRALWITSSLIAVAANEADTAALAATTPGATPPAAPEAPAPGGAVAVDQAATPPGGFMLPPTRSAAALPAGTTEPGRSEVIPDGAATPRTAGGGDNALPFMAPGQKGLPVPTFTIAYPRHGETPEQAVQRLLREQKAADLGDADDGPVSRVDPLWRGAAETAIASRLETVADDMTGVIAARLRSQKSRKGTRHWQPEYAVDTRIGEKALDSAKIVDAERWASACREALEPFLRDLCTEAAALVVLDLGLDPDSPEGKALSRRLANLVPAKALPKVLAAAQAALRLIEVSAERRAALFADLISEKEDEGLSLADIIAAVKALGVKGEDWAKGLALHATTAAVEGARDALVEHYADPDILRRWRCLAPETPVQAASATHVARRWNVDGLVRVRTRAGRVLAVTPDHPVLSNQGWVRADALDVGDHLVSDALHERAAVSDPDVENTPLTIEEVFAAARNHSPAERMVSVHVDLNGNGRRSEVEVVPLDSELRGRLQPSRRQPLSQAFFATADLDLMTFLASRDTGQRVGGSVHPTHLRCHAFANGGSFFGREAPGSDPTGRGLIPVGDVRSVERPKEDVLADTEAPTDRVLRITSSVGSGDVQEGGRIGGPTDAVGFPNLGLRFRSDAVALRGTPCVEKRSLSAQTTPDGFSARAHLHGNLPGRLAGLVALDEIVEVERDDRACHVYDLSTSTGWFLGSGVIVHNSQRDDKVRPTHVKADGQEQKIGEPFEVGTALLRYPGDSEAPMSETAGCRCMITFRSRSTGQFRARPAGQRDRKALIAGESWPRSLCPGCGDTVEYDPDNGWQRLDGSVSHDTGEDGLTHSDVMEPPEAKHLPGRHDQGSHGNLYRAKPGAVALPTGRWRKADRELVRAGRARLYGVTPPPLLNSRDPNVPESYVTDSVEDAERYTARSQMLDAWDEVPPGVTEQDIAEWRGEWVDEFPDTHPDEDAEKFAALDDAFIAGWAAEWHSRPWIMDDDGETEASKARVEAAREAAAKIKEEQEVARRAAARAAEDDPWGEDARVSAEDLERRRGEGAGEPILGRTRKPRTAEQEAREQYDLYVQNALEQAVQDTNAAIFSKEGKRLKINDMSLFTGRLTRRYASEELLEWWTRNPRLTWTQFRAQALGRDGDRRRGQNRRTYTGVQ